MHLTKLILWILMAGFTQITVAEDRELQQKAEFVTQMADFRSPWGYDLPVPFHQLPSRSKDHLRQTFPLEGIGAVLTAKRPFRASSLYLGKVNGLHLFAMSEHIGLDREPYAVELYDTRGGKLMIPLVQKSLFASVRGDVSIYQAEPDLPSQVEHTLSKTRPVQLLFQSVESFTKKHQRINAFVAGRAIYTPALKEMYDNPQLWPAHVVQLWELAYKEAEQNLDRRSEGTPLGDVFAVAGFSVLAGGMSQPLRDPDGLIIGSDTSTPFLQSRPDWAPVSYAGTYRSLGRLSGSPVFIKTPWGYRVIGFHWTKGVAEDVRQLIRDIAKNSSRAFGSVVVDQLNEELILRLEQTAPFAYFSSLEAAKEDLLLTLSNKTNGLSQQQRQALLGLVDLGSPNCKAFFQ